MRLNLSLARVAADAAMKKAQEDGVSLSVSVVDGSGRMVLCYRGDGTAFYSTDTSFAKAVAAAAFRAPTSAMSNLHDGNMAFWGNVANAGMTPFLPSIGALPIFVDGECIGAVGCGGAKSGEQDEACAQAAIDAVAQALEN